MPSDVDIYHRVERGEGSLGTLIASVYHGVFEREDMRDYVVFPVIVYGDKVEDSYDLYLLLICPSPADLVWWQCCSVAVGNSVFDENQISIYKMVIVLFCDDL